VTRLLRWKRLRWFAIGTLVRFLLKRTAARSVDRATADLEHRLPEPIRKALDVVPADAMRAGGSAVVAGRTARRVATGTRTASRLAGDRRQRVMAGVNRFRSIGTEIAREAEHKRRELKSEYLRATGGHAEADDALLDLRGTDLAHDRHRAAGHGDDRTDDDRYGHEAELPDVLPPVRAGRWRAERRIGTTVVGRVQRTYRRPSRPWDR
jgi:hypothetical protein